MVDRTDLLIDVAELSAALAGPHPPLLLDVRWRLGGTPGRYDYDEAHLPGAVYLDLDKDLCGPPGANGRHPLPHPDALESALVGAGVRAGQPVIVYDAGDGLAAARTWWTLRWAGHRQVRVLDGGFAAWVAAGGAVTAAVSKPGRGDFQVIPGGMPVLDAAAAAEVAVNGLLLDVRAAERFRGEQEPVDPVAGHIPGAVNLPTAAHVGADGRFHAVAALQESLTAVGLDADRPVGVYCGSGVTAAHTLLALHLAGRSDAALYVGSWSQWIVDPQRPVEVGATV